MISCNYRISYFLSQIIKPLIQASTEICESTEDLLSKIHSVNETEDLNGCIIGSMDVVALYPSIDIDFAVDRCVDLLKESDITFSDVDYDELGLYITLLTNKTDRIKEGVEQFCPTRKYRGKNPTITGCGSYTDTGRRWSFHNKANTKVSDPKLLKDMLSYAIGITLKATLNNHIFTFNQKIYKQTKVVQ